ncbi:MAG TPA: methyltransferase domain-containing protein [Acidimicrobiales bacterium]|nr:methyltransferase domain-containing protein [Acidimicrobiales bacterium]
MSTWPFWAATSDERIDTAFDLAGLARGERLLDLGCGDGRVLLRAAVLRGATARGVELDPDLASDARALLASNGVDPEVVEEDVFTTDLSADVVFCYLSPATLQRLRARFVGLAPGTRVVTTGYAIPGWEPDAVAARCYLYRLPPTVAAVDRARRGWDSGGLLVAVRPDTQSLVATTLHHGGGDVSVIVSGNLSDDAIRTGAESADPGDEVVVDLRLDPLPAGAVLTGALEAPGLGSVAIVVVVDEDDPAMWRVGEDEIASVARAVDRGDVAAVLRAARAAG